MKLSQKPELRRLLTAELTQSLQILSLPLVDLESLINEELVNNPFLEESPAVMAASGRPVSYSRSARSARTVSTDEDFDPLAQLTTAPSLQDVLLRQLDVAIVERKEHGLGVEIIGNLDDNGFLSTPLSEIALSQRVEVKDVEKVLAIIQKFEPVGVAARSLQESLLIQAEAKGEIDPLIKDILEKCLEDVALRRYDRIAKELGITAEEAQDRVRKIASLNPKPGQNYSPERSFHVIPDIFIDEKEEELEVFINQDNLPTLHINEEYRAILKKNHLAPEEKEYLREQLQNALELVRSIIRRRSTLQKVIEAIVGIQKEALLSGLSHLKPLTLQEVADKVGIHESTVSRVVMNKYAETPQGVIAIRDLFPARVRQENGDEVSSVQCKDLIRDLIEGEDKERPLSDEDLAESLFNQNGIKLARRTVAKYREELAIPSSTQRRLR
jgi:RNA polymerase sigma-54 factor